VALDYFTLAELRALPDVTENGFTDAKITSAGEFMQAAVESACQASFVGRSTVETLDGTGGTTLRLKTPYVLSITSVTVDGVTLTDQFTVDAGILERRTSGTYTPQPWTRGRRNIVVTYSAGYSSTPPSDIKDAVMWAVRDRLITQGSQNGIDVRRTSVTNDIGGTIQYVLPGENRPTGYPELDAVIARWSRKLNTVTYP
jgi:hypothetical protein